MAILDGEAAAAFVPLPHPSTSQINLSCALRPRECIQSRRGCGAAPRFPHAICNAADALITRLLSSHQLHPAADPRVQLRGNSSPVPETPPTPCSVAGTLPADLNGAYIRNGPNAAHLHNGEACHFFDGDGMLHCVKLSHGAATYSARYVKTSRFLQEEAAGRPLFPKFLGTAFTGVFGGIARTAVMFLRASLGLVDLSQGVGLSNTSVGFFKGKVLSMSEEDLPYVVKVTDSGDLETQERLELPGKRSMCAHPKLDAETGDMYAFSYPSDSMAHYSIFKVRARDGEKSDDVRVQLLDMPYVHDFAIARKYVVFPDSELVVRPLLASLRGEALVVRVDERKVARFCVLPRDIFDRPHKAAQEARWFDAPGCNCLHYVNAWDDDESQEIVLITPVLTPGANLLSLTDVSTSIREIRLNTQTGNVTSRAFSCGNKCEMGTMNQRYVGRKSRYAYFAEGTNFPQEMTAVVKVDVEAKCIVARRTFETGCSGGEPYFVSRHYMVKDPLVCHNNDPHQNTQSEDDGYLLCFVYNNSTHCSQLLVMNALSPSLDIIASIQLPTRVPFGLHGFFVSDIQLNMQNT